VADDATLTEVHLLGLPLHVRAQFLQHAEELLRELALVQLEAGQDSQPSLSPRLLQLASELADHWAPFQAQPAAVVAAALAAGMDTCDVTYTVPLRIDSFFRRVAQLLDEADDLCRREEHLLTLPAPPEVVDYRRWLFGQFREQLSGQAPRPWHRRLSARTGTVAPGAAAAPVHAPPFTSPRGGEPAAGSAEHLEPEKGDGEAVGEPLVMQSLASSVAVARRHVRQVLRELGRQALEESAELAVSELVSNAVLHAHTPFALTVRTMPTGRVRIEVSDSSPAPLQPRHFDVAATTGRGLQLVARLSFNWGIEERDREQGPGKTVWFEPEEITDSAEAAVGFDVGDWELNLHDLE
jgi:anti-sigma regulatory factor (Ser/Thr protein kinase)